MGECHGIPYFCWDGSIQVIVGQHEFLKTQISDCHGKSTVDHIITQVEMNEGRQSVNIGWNVACQSIGAQVQSNVVPFGITGGGGLGVPRTLADIIRQPVSIVRPTFSACSIIQTSQGKTLSLLGGAVRAQVRIGILPNRGLPLWDRGLPRGP